MQRETNDFKLPLGEQAPYFSLRGTDGRLYTLREFDSKPVLVIVFTCNHCPYARAYEPRLVELSRRFEPEGVQFVAICANDPQAYPEDDFEHMIARSKSLGFPFPYLQDESQSVSQAYDAQCTPECYVFDAERKLRYHGRVDDNYQDLRKVSSHDLRDAVEAVLAGHQPETSLTLAMGCSIKWKRQ